MLLQGQILIKLLVKQKYLLGFSCPSNSVILGPTFMGFNAYNSYCRLFLEINETRHIILMKLVSKAIYNRIIMNVGNTVIPTRQKKLYGHLGWPKNAHC